MRAGVVEGVAAGFDSQPRLIPARQLGIVDISEEWVRQGQSRKRSSNPPLMGASGYRKNLLDQECWILSRR